MSVAQSHAAPVLLMICLCLLTVHTKSQPESGQLQKLHAQVDRSKLRDRLRRPVLSRKTPQKITGTIVLNARDNQDLVVNVRIPDAKLVLQDSGSGKTYSEALSKLDGRFVLTAPDSGEYRVCWSKVDLTEGCSEDFAVMKTAVYLGQFKIKPLKKFFYGTSLLKKGYPCWINDPYFELDVSTRISLLDSTGNQVGQSVRANVSGEYVMAAERSKRYRLKAKCEESETISEWVTLGAMPRVDLPLKNHVPNAIELAVFDEKKGITRAEPGQVVLSRYRVNDKDNDEIEYLWRILDGSGQLSAANNSGSEQEWVLPQRPGLHSVYVMARDGKGGYAYKRLNLRVGEALLDFSGHVLDEVSREPIAGATVTTNGVSTSTNSMGWFNLRVKAARNERYVVNVNRQAYASLARVFDKSNRAGTYELIRTQISSHNPKFEIDVIDQASSGPCGGSDHNPSGGKNRSQARFRQEDADKQGCDRRGVHLKLPPNSLVRSNNQPAKGPVTLSIATLNPARRALSGDYRAISREGRDEELVSFGAVFIEFKDAGNKPLNLKRGHEAQLSVPISAEQFPNARSRIAMWLFDEKTGLWIEEGEAELRQTANGPIYVGTTRHFSTINMDVGGGGTNNTTCVRFELDPSLRAWNNLILRAYVPVGGTAVQTKEVALNDDQYHAVFRIPYADPPLPNTLRLELRGSLEGGQEVILLNDSINTDTRPKMTGDDLWPDYPYTECGVPVVLTADPVTLPYYGDINATGRPAFLTGPYGSYLPVDGEQVSADYYAAIDPDTAKDELGKWWVENNFAADGSGGTRVSYLNHNDLGFGRDMHCLQTGSDLACYVTNYGLPDQNPSNADDAESANPLTRGATVTMEYDASVGDTGVSFYVFNGGDNRSPRISFADLDGLGPKPIPHLCMVCHGGFFDASDNKVHGAKFREFDLPSFQYSGSRGWDFAPAPNTLQNSELDAFKVLNQMVADTNIGNKIEALINAWYPGTGNTPMLPTVPAGWEDDPATASIGEEDVYHRVYGSSCRTCHIARSGITDVFSSFSETEYTVCDSTKVMPNAFVTYKNFWSNQIRIDEYKTATSAESCQ